MKAEIDRGFLGKMRLIQPKKVKLKFEKQGETILWGKKKKSVLGEAAGKVGRMKMGPGFKELSVPRLRRSTKSFEPFKKQWIFGNFKSR